MSASEESCPSDRTSPPPSPPPSPDPDRDAHFNLLALLAAPEQSTLETIPPPAPPSHLEDQVTPYRPLIHRPITGAPPSPVPIPTLQDAVHRYLTARDLNPDRLHTAVPLLNVAGIRPPLTLKRRVLAFERFAKSIDLPFEDCPLEGDFRWKRCWVRVLYAVAFVAKHVDTDLWEQCSRGFAVSGEGWAHYAMDEAWEGDAVIRDMVRIHGRGFGIVMAGSQGGGKSATIGRVLGRRGLPESHALAYVGKQGNDEKMYRHIRAISWPVVPLEWNVPVASRDVDRVYVKVGGHVVTFVELPSMEKDLAHVDGAAVQMKTELGKFERVVAEVQGDVVEYVILCERLDEVEVNRLRSVVARVVRLYGRAVVDRMMVVLTHGQATPPDRLSYQVWVFDRVRVVKEVLRKWGRADVGVVVVENSANCRADGGAVVLPDGTAFMDLFLDEFSRMVDRGKGVPLISPIPCKRWWEDYVVLFGIGMLIMRLL
eukprot:GFKZ01002605.1.p1 GENE.GFKZ01002605.1~~GFKZ01002605.1.p1  ORF type:complete len:484 (+),score=63.08 GFKZ01002605.1:40-1491(+)